MRLLQNLPIKRKLVVITMLASGIALVVACVAFFTYEQFTARKRLVQDLSIIAEMTGANSAAGLTFDEPSSVEQSLKSLSVQPSILAACVYDKEGQPFARYKRVGEQENFLPPMVQETGYRVNQDRLDIFQEIHLASERIGTVYISMDLSEMTARVWRYLLIVCGVLCSSALIVFFLSARLQKVISEPILDLVRTARSVANEKNYSVRAVKRSQDELGVLIDGFNEMLAQIQARDTDLQAAHSQLERRVEERTRELQNENAERRLAEEAVRESQALYHSLVEQLPVGVFRKDKTGRYVFVNSWFCKLKGVHPELFLGKTPAEVAATEMQGRTESDPRTTNLAAQGASDHELIMTTGQSVEAEEHYPDANGVKQYLHVVKSPVFGPDGTIVGSQGILMDVSQLKQAQEEVAREHLRLKFIFESLPIGIACNMPQADGTSIRIVNDTHLRIAGITRETEKEPDIWQRISHPEDYARQDALRRQLEEGKITQFSLDKRYVRPNGQTVWVILTWQRLKYSDGTFEDLSTVVDITERKRAEAGLAYQRDLLNTLMDNLPDAIYFKDLESRFVRASRSKLEKCFEIALHHHRAAHPSDGTENLPAHLRNSAEFGEFLAGKTDFDFMTGDCARSACELEQEIIRTGKPLMGRVDRVVQTTGEVRWVLSTKMPWRDQDGKIIGTFGASKDITSMKEAEVELAYERDLLKTLLDNLPDAIYFKDLQSRFVRYSKSFAKHFSVEDPEAIRGKRDTDFFTPEHAQPAFEDEQEIIRTGLPVIGKVEKETHVDGHVTWALTNKMPWRDKEGNIIGTFGTSKDITSIKEAEAKLEAVHRQLLETSRQAGMAEVATSVLHNVGNVLNSVNTSASVITDLTRASTCKGVAKLADLLEQNRHDLAGFLATENRAAHVINYLKSLYQHLAGEQATVLRELNDLNRNIEHIKEIVAMQQSYAKVSGVVETQSVCALVEDALRMHAGGLVRHQVQVIKKFDTVPDIPVERHKVLQILVNLISNAKYAVSNSSAPERLVTLAVHQNGKNLVHISVADNGVGIAPENLTRIFAHGFTTKRNGHGFGLHSGALAAREMGGSLLVHSDGPDKGAVFTLALPIDPKDVQSK